jgi:hypothetical protein
VNRFHYYDDGLDRIRAKLELGRIDSLHGLRGT